LSLLDISQITNDLAEKRNEEGSQGLRMGSQACLTALY